MSKEKKDEFPSLIQKEIENSIQSGLIKESDYNKLEQAYELAELPQQSGFIEKIKKEKFPDGNWLIGYEMNKLNNEKDRTKRVELAKSILERIKTDPNPLWRENTDFFNRCKSIIVGNYIFESRWDLLKIEMEANSDKTKLADILNSAAWDMQEKNKDLEKALELSTWATEVTRNEIKTPTTSKPEYLTTSGWAKQREVTYAMFTDTYAMVQYKLGNYQKGFDAAYEAAIKIQKGRGVDYNNTYALLAEKVLSPDKLKSELEQFVRDGKANSTIKDILKKNYAADKKGETGFDDYIKAIERESYLKLIEETRKGMLDQKSPSFALKNMNGEMVSLESLKGKVVIVDFWATWCGPCKASFPGMQSVVNKYIDNPGVQFLFVDTWERGQPAEILKNASEFMAQNKYTFNVLMDDDNSVIEKFKVDGIPTKFVIDKNGHIRFKSVGYGGNDDKLAKEIDLMIELCNDPNKAF